MTDCLLQAYDCVARRAYQIFLERGGKAGGELDDWLSAERELLGSLAVDLAEGDDYVSALASLPGLSGEEIEIGIDPRWIVILGRRAGDCDIPEFYPDPHRVAEFSRAVNSDARTVRLVPVDSARPIEIKEESGASHPQMQDQHVQPDAALVCLPQQAERDATQPGQRNPAPGAPFSGNASQWREPAGSRGAETANGAPASVGFPSKVFCVLELPAEVDPERSIAVLANGLLGIHMPKAVAPHGAPC